MPTYRKRGDVWRAEVRRKGVYVSESFANKADAVQWATAREHEINLGTLTASTTHTVADAFREYEKRVSVGKAGRRWESIKFIAFIRDFPKLAAMKLGDVTAADFGKWRDDRLKTVGTATVLREINLYSHVFTTARDEWKWMTASPLSGMRRPTEPAPRTRRITDGEIKTLTDHLGYSEEGRLETKSARVGAALLFALETAMRAGEIVALDWPNVHIAERFAHLPKTKNGTARNVPLSKRALDILAQLEKMKADFKGSVFGLSSDSLTSLFAKAKKAMLLDDLHFHDSRREALTRLASIFSVMELAKISGHKDLRILQSVYFEPHAADLADKLHQAST